MAVTTGEDAVVKVIAPEDTDTGIAPDDSNSGSDANAGTSAELGAPLFGAYSTLRTLESCESDVES